MDVPLGIDSPDPSVIRAVLPLLKKTPMVNSITLEPSRLGGILPLVAEYKTKVIALCQLDEIVSDTVEAKLRIAGQLVEKVTAVGIPLEDLYIDPLLYPLATDQQSALTTLGAIERIIKEFVGVHTTCGLTNLSYGLPNRRLINRTFLTDAIARGLDSAIMDPTDKQL
jgi:5-methyltetrahydrofolate--homocysteine methyltransferase